MKILHITPSSGGYEEVELIANRISSTNHLALIKKSDGNLYQTGGYLINDAPQIRAILDSMKSSDQYSFIKTIKDNPFTKSYADESDLKT